MDGATIGRGHELTEVETLIDRARGGTSGALLVCGEPGIGKTTLLSYARVVAEDTTVLAAEGTEAESNLAFAGLARLLGPILDRLTEVPPPQAQALRGALALGPPQPGDRFTASAATLSLLAAAAEDGPLVCIVDDAHWLDAESFEALQFAARRLGAEGIAMVLTAREGISQRVDDASLPRLRLEGLSGRDAARLIAERTARVPDSAVLRELVAGAAGNPMALIELAGALSEDQLNGSAPLPDPLPVGPHLRRALLRPLAGLPAATQRALVVASADQGASELLAGALAVEGLAMTDLEPAERAGAVFVTPTGVTFSHPLVRCAIYQAAAGPDRRAAHRAHAAAAANLGDAAALDRRAWHLALASMGPDEAAALELERAAGRAAARTGYAAACEAMEAAGRLSPSLTDMGRRLLGAGQSALASGGFPRAARLFDEVVALNGDPAQTVEAMAGRGFVEIFGGSSRRAVDMLVAAADRMAPIAPEAAAALLVEAVVPCFMRTDLRRAAELVARARDLAGDGPPALMAQIEKASVITDVFRARPRRLSEDARLVLERQAEAGDPLAHVLLLGVQQCLMVTERYGEAIAGLDAIVTLARGRSTPSALPWPLAARAEVRRRTGRLREADADASEALRLAEDTGQEGLAGYAASILALVDAVLGRGEACRAHAARARRGFDGADADSVPMFADAALGLLALGERDLDRALRHMVANAAKYREIGDTHPLISADGADLVETLLRLGRLEDAASALAMLETTTRTSGAVWPAAAIERCRGIVAADRDFEGHFATALALHAGTTTPFENARTLLCLGERRRRARRVRDARRPLSEALEAFEVMGAASWAEWARAELRAAGARARDPRPVATAALTPQELQVALAVAEGATNKEVATALLLSPKTIEYHLGRVYVKLGVRSRSALAARIARETSHLLPSGDAD